MKQSASMWTRIGSVVLAVLGLALAAPVGAADDVARICGLPLTPSPAFERRTLIDATATDIAADRLQPAFDRIAATYEQAVPPGEAAAPAVAAFLRQLRAPTSRWSALWAVGVDEDTAGPILFERDKADRQVRIACSPAPVAAQYHDMVAIANYLQTALAAREAPGKQAQWLALKKQATDHEDLIRNGLPMWPWELWLNGKRLGKSDADRLFDTQVVFMRPSAGVEINTRSRERATLQGSLMLEPIGFVKYYEGSRYSRWWGVSAVITAATDRGFGYGALVRYGRYSAGLTLHKSEVPGVSNDVHLLLGFDLYDLVERNRGELPAVRDGIKRSVAEMLQMLP